MDDSAAQNPSAVYQPSRGKLIGAIVAFLWGTSIIVHSLSIQASIQDSYVMGQRMAGLAGLVLFGFGARQLWRELRSRREG